MPGVVQCLLRLVQVQILGSAALADDDDICRCIQLLQVDGIQEPTALPVRQHWITGYRF